MDINNFKHIVGQVKESEPVVIRFFGPVNECSVRDFNEEFLWLQNVIQPPKIIVMINSEGGSVIHGMSTFSLILACPIEVDCVIEGIAASMGSVLWAAGDNLYMHDYSLLMIHNPFVCGVETDENTKQQVNAFKNQLEIIYKRRFGMTKEQVKKIMDGEENVDGTFFTAKEAVEAGFIDGSHVIKTSKLIRDKVKFQIEGMSDISNIRDIMSSVSAEINENKLIEGIVAIRNRKDNQHFQESKIMENETLNFETISAQLGFTKDAQVAQISARVTNLIKAEADLKILQDTYSKLEIKNKGTETELANTISALKEAKASLKKYEDAEKAAFEAKVNATIEDAIKAGKIEESAKEAWAKMAISDFATVEATLNSIHGREDIASKIANDPENKNDIESTVKSAEEKMAKKVKEVVGEVKALKF